MHDRSLGENGFTLWRFRLIVSPRESRILTADADLQLTFGILSSGYVILQDDFELIRLNRQPS